MTRRTFLVSAAASMWSVPGRQWIAMDLAGNVRDGNWSDATHAVSLGSLLKPFLALSYLSTHAQAPIIECRGAAAGCWYPLGHGKQDIVAALANSCNVYFRRIAETLDRAALDLTCLAYGLTSPPRSWKSARLIGLGNGWPQSPFAAARAFALLGRNRTDARVKTVLAGMARCARAGTAKQIGFACYAKTGTAPCMHGHGGLGDGYVVALYPLDQPRRVVLLVRHNMTGANAAKDLKPLVAQVG